MSEVAATDNHETFQRPIKVIHVIGGGEFGGAEQHILDLLTVMKQHGVQGKVVCFYEASFSQALRERGIPVTVLDYGRFDIRLARGLRKLFHQEKPDLIHTHGVKANFFARLAARNIDNVPLVTTVHSLLKFDYEGVLAYKFASWMENSSRRWNSHYISVSGAIRQSLLDEKIPPEQITVVRHGIDVERFRPVEDGDKELAARREALRKEWGVPDDAWVIGSVGRLVRLKGIDYAIQAMPGIIKVNPRAHLVIVGSGPEETRLQALAAQLGLGKHVTFTGFRKDIPDCMRAFDCFISPSLSEGLGLNILEAMATRLPVVITGVGGILDFAEDEVNSLIIETRSAEDLADKLIRILESPELAERLASRGRDRVVRDFSIQSMGQNTLRVYHKLLNLFEQLQSMERDPNVKRMIISGYYGYGNSGDEAVLHSILQALREESEKMNVRIAPIVMSNNPQATAQMHGVMAIHRFNVRKILKNIRRSDGLISGGGSLLQDITGRMTIPYYLSVIKFAQWFGKPTFIYAQGVGPIQTKSFYPFIRYIYRRCEYISVRDRESGELLQEIGIDGERIDVVSDPVMGITYPGEGMEQGAEVRGSGFQGSGVGRSEPGRSEQGKSGPESSEHGRTQLGASELGMSETGRSGNGEEQDVPVVIGVSVRFWHPYREDLQRLATALGMILDAMPQAKLRFLPFYPPNDTEASRYVIERLRPEHRQRTDMYEDAVYPMDMFEQVSTCDLLIGVRLHSLIYAAVMGVPLLGISYDPKIDHFLHQLDMKVASWTDDFDPCRVAEEALILLNNRNAWKKEKQPYIADLKQKSLRPAKHISAYIRT